MKQVTKRILGIAGVISSIVGIVAAIPAFFQEKYTMATFSIILIVGGLVLFAISFED